MNTPKTKSFSNCLLIIFGFFSRVTAFFSPSGGEEISVEGDDLGDRADEKAGIDLFRTVV